MLDGHFYFSRKRVAVASRSSFARPIVLLAVVVATSWGPSARGIAESGQNPALTSVGPLAFSADGTLFAADNLAATVFALDLGTQASGAAPGTRRNRSR